MVRSTFRRRLATLAVVVTGLAALAACGSTPVAGPTTTQKRDVSDASAVVLAGVGRLDVALGKTPSLTITAGRNVMSRITSEVDDGVLVLDVEGPVVGLTNITYDLVLPAVEAVTVSGAGAVEAKLGAADSLRVVLGGAGDIAVGGVGVADLDVTVSGAGQITLAGEAERQHVVISGLGRYNGTALSSGDADVLVSGAGSADVLVKGSLEARVTGAGSITYAGSPTVTSTVTGVGSVRQRQ